MNQKLLLIFMSLIIVQTIQGQYPNPVHEQAPESGLVNHTGSSGERTWVGRDYIIGENFWNIVLDLGVDMLSTDKPREIKSYFKKRRKHCLKK